MNLKPVAVIVVLVAAACAGPAGAAGAAGVAGAQTEVHVGVGVGEGSQKSVRYCQAQTPCAWRVYNHADYSEISLTNNYCVCRPGLRCRVHETRLTEGYLELRCKL